MGNGTPKNRCREINQSPFSPLTQLSYLYFMCCGTHSSSAPRDCIAARSPGMAKWREHLFAWMLRNAESAMEFFKLPPNRVVELGSQVEI